MHMRRSTFGQPTFATLHSSADVKVSREEAIRMDSEDTQHLIEQRKLALIVDLDQTIIHVTVDPTVKEWAHDPKNPNWCMLKDVVAFQLGSDGKTVSHQPERMDQHDVKSFATDGDENGCWYYVKLRPGLQAFLQSVSPMYEMHVYTMGTRSYADCICRIVDPDGHLFGARILSRDENGNEVQKSLSRLFPISTDMVVVIDDRADVWSWSPNLIKVEPYEFFVGIGDINAAHLGPTKLLVSSGMSDTSNTSAQGETLLTDEQQQRVIAEQCDSRPLQRAAQEKHENKVQAIKDKTQTQGQEKDQSRAQSDGDSQNKEMGDSQDQDQDDLKSEVIQQDLVLTDDDTELELIQTVRLRPALLTPLAVVT